MPITAYQLPPLVRLTDATASGLWQTPVADDAEKRGNIDPTNPRNVLAGAVKMWPTPTAHDWKGSGPTVIRKDGKMRGDRLDYAVEQFATPQARDFRTGSRGRWENPERTRNLNDQIGGKLNPTWVEWLMGLPCGWTDCGLSATRSSRKSPK